MRRSISLVRRIQPRRVASATSSYMPAARIIVSQRHMGFWEDFKKRIQQEKSKDEKYQEAVKQLEKEAQESDTLKAAAEAARKASEAAAKAADIAKERATIEAERAKVVSQRVGKKVGEITDDVRDRIDEFSDTPFVSQTGRVVGKTASKISEHGGNVLSKVEEVAAKIAETETAKKVAEQFKDDEGPKSTRVEDVPINRETQDVIIRPATEWERKWQRIVSTPIIGPVIGGISKVKEVTAEVVSTAGDKVFGETETGIVMGEIRKIEPHFHLPRFVKNLQEKMIPLVIEAFLKGDLKTLRPLCLERSYTVMSYAIRDRQSKGHTVDARILQVGDCDLVAARLVDDQPVLIFSFSVQQIHCVRDKAGKVVEGSEGNIQVVYYAWAMQIDPDSADSDWKLSEMHIQGAFPQIA